MPLFDQLVNVTAPTRNVNAGEARAARDASARPLRPIGRETAVAQRIKSELQAR